MCIIYGSQLVLNQIKLFLINAQLIKFNWFGSIFTNIFSFLKLEIALSLKIAFRLFRWAITATNELMNEYKMHDNCSFK